jgi:hypothetical protein
MGQAFHVRAEASQLSFAIHARRRDHPHPRRKQWRASASKFYWCLVQLVRAAAAEQPEALVKIARLIDSGQIVFFQSPVTRRIDQVKARRFSQDTAAFNDSDLYGLLRRLEDPKITNAPPPAPEVALVAPGPCVSGVPEHLARWRENSLHYELWPGAFCAHLLANEEEMLETKGILCATSFAFAHDLDSYTACDDCVSLFTVLISTSESEAEGSKVLDPRWRVDDTAAWYKIRAAPKVHFRVWSRPWRLQSRPGVRREHLQQGGHL